jgi:hypothetical protein
MNRWAIIKGPSGTKRGARRIALVFGLAAFAFCLLLAAPSLAADSEPGSPATRLYDVPRGDDSTLSQRLFQHKEDWKLIPEDTLQHGFESCALMVNDKLAVLFRGVKGLQHEVNVLALNPRGAQYRATIAPADPRVVRGDPEIRIVENSAAAVTIEMRWKTPDGPAITIAYRLAAGQPIIELRPGDQVPLVGIFHSASHAVVPDFFGDDMVLYVPSPQRTVGLPVENFFLSLSEAGDSMMMCVWPSNRQGADNYGDGYTVDCAAGKPIWLAFLETAGIWHTLARAKKSGDQIVADCKVPFSAKWRADLVGPGLPPRSWYFEPTGDAKKAPEPTGDHFILENGRAKVEVSMPRGSLSKSPEPSLVVYPIDRDRQTPLDVFTPMDVLRNTLGVGPCQYILQTEGLTSEDNPTPDNVMTWVEKQFARKKQKKSADEIREMLGRMGSQVAATQARIDRYAAVARELRKLVGEKELIPNGATWMMSFRETLAYLDHSVAEGSGVKAVEGTQRLAAEVVALVEKPDAADACRKLGDEVRQIGLAQERTLARCRMALRWVRAQAKMAVADKTVDKKTLELAKTVQARVEEVLYAK